MLLNKKEEIARWLHRYNVKNYELILDKEYDYVVNVNESVNLWNKNLKSIDVKFNKIEGDFFCGFNKLESLKGCPEIVNGNFSCNNNNLISLKDSPKIVNGDFSCSYNQLESLECCPEVIYKCFYCEGNLLTIDGLKYLSKKVGDDIFIFKNSKLVELQKIKDFTNLKEKLNEIFNIEKGKDNLLNIINKQNVQKNIINKI